MQIISRLTVVLACSVAFTACSGGTLAPPSTQAPSTTEDAAPPPPVVTLPSSTTTTPVRDCTPLAGTFPQVIDETDPTALSIILSGATFPCADEIVIAPAAQPRAAAAAALHAANVGGPLLLAGNTLDSLIPEIERLDPSLITVAGTIDPADPVLAGRGASVPAGGLEIRGGIVQGPDPARLLVVGDSAAPAWPAVWAAARAAGDTAVLAHPDDLRSLGSAALRVIRLSPDADATLIGPGGEDAGWQLDVIRSGLELPGGGLLLFPDRRIIAFYGQPQTSDLGVLGEQGLDGAQATIDRMAPIVAQYAADGIPAIPAFEIIATVAAALPTDDGDYSYETPPDLLRPWIEKAGEQGVYVILDLQPGRTDFLTQAKIYEEFIRLPHVGLAIDPEWRLGPDQVHLRQIGSVDASEINEVAEWMAGIVREEALPQKMLLLHQFTNGMIPNRQIVELRPELAIVVQMDGQGTLADKYGTWGALTTQPDSGRYWWGWKNFYDEDVPMATPPEVLELAPVVFYVSFQ